MYLSFYQLSKKPFSLAPDPEFLYLSQQHKDALGAIIYGIKEREGFISVIGEVGTGKTTIVRSYLHKTDRNEIQPIFIFNSKITFSELMEVFLDELGISADVIQQNHSVNDMVRLAYRAMIKKTRQGKNLVLIIDEAQNMPVETLRSLCVLSNFETAKAKLIQIVLVGQPELQKKLDLYELRQLRQRVAYRAQIKPLSTKESIGYLHHRLSLASRGQKPVFTTSAIRRIVKHSKGVPRVINILCENSLVAGYGLQEKPVSLGIVNRVVAEYEGKRFSGQFQFTNVAGGVLILLLTALLAASYVPSSHNSPPPPKDEQARVEIAPVQHQQPARSHDKVVPSGKKVVTQIGDEDPVPERNAQTILAPDDSRSANVSTETTQLQPSEPLGLARLPDVSRESSTTSVKKRKSQRPRVETNFPASSGRFYISSEKSSPLEIVKKGDTVSKLCIDKYGFYNTQLLSWLKTHNPHIPNLEEIQIDEIIFFPEMEPSILLNMDPRTSSLSSTTKEEVVLR